MMKFKLLFKKGHNNNPSTKSTETNQHVPSASSTTTATISNAGAAAGAARSHFGHEKHSKQNKNKTSVKKLLNTFHEETGENPKKNLNKVLQTSQEKLFSNIKTTTSVQTKDNSTKFAVPVRTNGENNLKSVNNSTGVCNKKHFDKKVYPDKSCEHIHLISNNNVNNLPIQCDNKSTELNVCPGDEKEKSSASKLEPNNSDWDPESESRLGTVSGHALIGHSLKIMEYQELKQQLDSVSNEKQMLETKINELLNYQESLKDELCKMKDIQDSGGGGGTLSSELDTGGGGSAHILSRSPLSDTPPHPLPLPSTPPPRHATSAPPSIGDVSGTGLLLDTPDWDKHSSSSLSEISVACLQDRITQMEETHYCTNEELQATLQELADLQNQLIDLQHTNETLGHEKSVLLESLCRQTEKLEDTRTKAETLQELLLSRDENQQGRLGVSEREGKLVELLKSAQLEKETLLGKHEESMSELSELRRLSNAMKQDTERLSERVRQLESTIDATHADKHQLDQQLGLVREEASSRTLEINRLKNLLDNARAKIEELEEDRANLRNKTELDELLDQTRREKDCLESQVAILQDSMSRSECKTSQQEEIILRLKEEMKVIRNNAKSSLSDMEYERDLNQKEIARLTHELELLQENYNELQVQVQNHLEDKRQLKSLLSETQKQLSETQQSLDLTSKRLTDESQLRSIENEEWQVFQRDLLTTVRVANDFKSETAQKLESVLIENKQLKEKNRTLTSQLEKLKKVEAEAAVVKPVLSTPLGAPLTPCSSPSLLYRPDNGAGAATTSSVLSSVMQRNHFSREDSRLSVKSLIESIENATKQAKSGPSSSLSSSSSSLNSGSGGGGGVMGGPGSPSSALSPMEESHRGSQTPQSSSGGHHGILNSGSGGSKKSNLNMLSSTPDIVHETLKPASTIIKSEEAAPSPASSAAAALLESMVRRNSQTDLSERKDPLQALVKNGGSRRNALLKWCQNKTLGYHNIDITNFSSSWNDGLALCAILHSYLPSKVPYDTLTPNEKRRNFTIAFSAAESVGIPTTLNTSDMITQERPDWNQVMAYITSIYKHFET
uniref:Cytospin-A n=1 Tax=Cacopsylla melanoneura TaxID=428564 RepID=A0A8D8PZQ6_9HEMI